MKKIVLISAFLFVIYTNSKAQNTIISITTLQELTAMSSNEFEDWGLMKGFKFSDSEDYSNFNTIKCGIKNKYFISKAINKDGTSYGFVVYATSNSIEYMNIKKNCTKFGYKFVKSHYVGNGEGGKVLFHEYESKTFKLTFYKTSPHDDAIFDFNINVKNKSINKY